jgi:hypothetical protein
MKLNRAQAREFKKCRNDPVYFIEKYIKLRHPKRGTIPFKMYPWQKEAIGYAVAGKNVSMKKSRQQGASWSFGAYTVWRMIFLTNQEIQLFSIGERQAISLLRKIKFMYKSVPSWLRHPIVKDREQAFAVAVDSLDTATGKRRTASMSIVDSFPSSKDAGRGETPNFTFFDEHASQQNDRDIWAAVQPALLHGGLCVSVSTPKPPPNVYEEVFQLAESGLLDNWVAMRVHYTDSGFDEGWVNRQTVGLTPAQIMQEYELQTISGENPVFDPGQLALVYRPIQHPNGIPGLRKEWATLNAFQGEPMTKERFDEEYAELLHKIEITQECYTGVDSSEGKGQDQNSICSLNEYGIQIAAEHNNMTLPQWAGYTDSNGQVFVGYVTKWHRRYPGQMVIEENGPGLVVYNQHSRYDTGYTVHKKRAVDNVHHTGIRTRIINDLILAVAGGNITITDQKTYEQLRSLQRNERTGKIAAPPGMLDDAVFSLAWSYHSLLQHGVRSYEMAGAVTGGQRIFSGPVEPASLEIGDRNIVGIPMAAPSTIMEDGFADFDLDIIRGLR